MQITKHFARLALVFLVSPVFAKSLDQSPGLAPLAVSKPKLSIVVDDLGNNSIIAKELLSLPGKITAAIMPETPHAKFIANLAFERGHDVIVHMPMEALSRSDLLTKNALTASMNQEELIATFESNLGSVPHNIGFNNHMGSLLTQDRQRMQWLMDAIKDRPMLFLDSKTSEDSIAEYIALKEGVPTVARDVFLDHRLDSQSLEKQFSLLKQIARRKGRVIVICHPHQATLDFLRKNVDELNHEFNLVGISDLLETKKSALVQLQPIETRADSD